MATINYKEKYEKAVQAAMLAKQDTESAVTIGILEEIFPELAESEDERIRKVLLNDFKNNCSEYYCEGVNRDMIIAWLERQGEQKPTIIIPKFRVGDEIKTVNEESLTITKIDEKGYWSEDLFICGFDDAAKWELVEQNPIDKIQLGKKYKCIASPRYSTFRIGEIYKPEDKFLCSLMNFCSDCFEPIEDEQKPAWSEEDRQTLRLIIDDLSEELNDEPDEADKEILCRKISFLNSLKPQPIHKWDREDNKIKVEITNYLECQKREEPTRKDILNKWISWIASLNPQCKQCSTTWSGEDERRRKRIVERLENIRKSKEDNIDVASIILSEINWLKSLKDRVQLPPKQEWSEEEKKRIDRIIDVLDWAEDKGRISYSDWEEYITYVRFLRPQSNQSWYKLDNETQKEIVNYFEAIKEQEPTRIKTLNGWINWLKSLRPQNTWKPSDEQMWALSTLANIPESASDTCKKTAQELLEQLKKL